MPFTLQTVTVEERIAETVHDDRYIADVESILSDEQSGWTNNLLAANTTFYDYNVTATRMLLKQTKDEWLAADTLTKKLTADLQTKEGVKKFADSIRGIKASRATAIADCTAASAEVLRLTAELKHFEALQEIGRMHLRSLRKVVGHYKENHDIEYLKRGVHCLATIAAEKMQAY